MPFSSFENTARCRAVPGCIFSQGGILDYTLLQRSLMFSLTKQTRKMLFKKIAFLVIIFAKRLVVFCLIQARLPHFAIS